MGKIKVNPELLRQSSQSVKEYADRINDILGNIDRLVGETESIWQGESFNAYQGMYSEMRPKINELTNFARDMSSNLKLVADTMQAKDEKLVSNRSY